MVDSITRAVTGETALWADANALQGLLDGLIVALGDELGGGKDALLHLLLVLQLWELAGHDAQNDVLVLRQLPERLEASARGVSYSR